MNDNLPEINFKEKKEKKGGLLGWLRGKLGAGSRGGAMGGAGINPSAMNVGRALGTAKFGASTGGLAGLLSGNLGMIATVALVAVAGGMYLANNAPAPSTSTSAFSSGKTGKDYVPAILRSQAANQGSSLDMFKDTNKGAGLAMEGDAAKAAADKAAAAAAEKAAADKAAAENEATAQDPGQSAPGMGQDMMGKLQGGSMGSLTSSLGGGSSKFSSAGGFGNKFNQGATGAKTGLNTGIGAGFSGMPKFDSRKNKMLAMKGSARPVFSGAKAGAKGAYGPKSLGQAKGLRSMQKTYTGTNVDSARGTQDKAWEGSTAEGSAGAGGAGLSEGGAGVMSSPSLDTGGSSGGGGGSETPTDPIVPDVTGKIDASPWAGLPQKAMMYIMLSLVLSAIASYLVSIGNTPFTFYLKVIGWVLAAAAVAAAAMAIAAAAKIMGFGQSMMGGLYMVGGVMALANAALSFAGNADFNAAMRIMGVMAGVAVLIGSMLGGK